MGCPHTGTRIRYDGMDAVAKGWWESNPEPSYGVCGWHTICASRSTEIRQGRCSSTIVAGNFCKGPGSGWGIGLVSLCSPFHSADGPGVADTACQSTAGVCAG